MTGWKGTKAAWTLCTMVPSTVYKNSIIHSIVLSTVPVHFWCPSSSLCVNGNSTKKILDLDSHSEQCNWNCRSLRETSGYSLHKFLMMVYGAKQQHLTLSIDNPITDGYSGWTHISGMIRINVTMNSMGVHVSQVFRLGELALLSI